MNSFKQDKINILEIKILKKGKKQEILNWDFANQDGNEKIKMNKIKKIENILLYSASQTPPTNSNNLFKFLSGWAMKLITVQF